MYFPIYTQEAGNIILTYNNYPSTHTKYVYLPSETNAVQQLKAWSIYWAGHLFFLWLSIGALDVYILFFLHRSSRIGAMFSMPEGS